MAVMLHAGCASHVSFVPASVVCYNQVTARIDENKEHTVGWLCACCFTWQGNVPCGWEGWCEVGGRGGGPADTAHSAVQPEIALMSDPACLHAYLYVCALSSVLLLAMLGRLGATAVLCREGSVVEVGHVLMVSKSTQWHRSACQSSCIHVRWQYSLPSAAWEVWERAIVGEPNCAGEPNGTRRSGAQSWATHRPSACHPHALSSPPFASTVLQAPNGEEAMFVRSERASWHCIASSGEAARPLQPLP